MGTIVIAGGTGLLGSALLEALRLDGHRVVVLSRDPKHDHEVRWSPGNDDRAWVEALNGATAVINLAGTSIASGRWTTARKASIHESRKRATAALVRAIADLPQPPSAFISGSAVGYYGARGDEPATEATPPGSDFLAQVCRDWESIAKEASHRSRVVLLRSGVVFARQGGALPQLALPFKLFAGGPAGTGRQFVSWIHLHDWVAMVKWALATATIAGPLNVTAPTPVTNEELSREIGRALGRPSWLKAPSFALRLVLGEMADALVLGGQRVIPEVARTQGFVFRYPTVQSALKEIYR
ncbi:MAG TPA: TIGR01777 family oxidoreductase [Vicinamibacterales bacterium]|nr:TIGR01777 family oxidoreductase [Vicinamibacterales bacterium]